MNPALLLAGVAALAAGVVIGRPAWTAWRGRAASVQNEERYLAWRGRADRVPSGTRLSRAERLQLGIGIGLGAMGVACLLISLGSA